MKNVKLIMSVVLALAVVLSLATFAMAAEEHVCEYVKVWEEADKNEKVYVKYACECGDYYVEHEGYRCASSVVTVETCTRDGYIVHYCPVCDEHHVETIPAFGHSYELTEEVFPTCTEDGHNTYTCATCGDSYTDVVPAMGHNIVAKNEEIIYPTCTDEGVDVYYYCGDCCTYFADAGLTTLLEDQTGKSIVLEATGHNIVAQNEEIIYPTCTDEGVDVYYYCGDCCTYFADADLTTPLEDQTGKSIVLAATGHNIVAKNEAVIDPTCTEEGLIVYYYCGDCCTYFADAELTTLLEDQTGIHLTTAATGHNYVNGVCDVCGAKDPDYNPGTADMTALVYVGIIMIMAMGGFALVATKKSLI